MDRTITQAILYGVRPPRGLYFTVRVEYNTEHPMFGGQISKGTNLVSSPIGSFPEAMDVSEKIAETLRAEKFTDSELVEVDPEQMDGFHLYIQAPDQQPLARVGIDTHDHRKETFH